MDSTELRARVRAAFDRAAPSYDAAAIVQREIGWRLLDELTKDLAQRPGDPARILDAGCGTGFGARVLRERFPGGHIDAIDFAPAMLRFARAAADACTAADIEALPFADASFDLWWSNLTIQWCDAAIVFAEACRVLRTGGRLAVSTLGSGTFAEMRSAFAVVDPHRHTLPFSEPGPLHAALAAAGFVDIRVLRETHTVHYPDLKTLLYAVKAIGANTVGDGGRSGMLGRLAWQRVAAAYEPYRTPAGLPASYDVIILCAERGASPEETE